MIGGGRRGGGTYLTYAHWGFTLTELERNNRSEQVEVNIQQPGNNSGSLTVLYCGYYSVLDYPTVYSQLLSPEPARQKFIQLFDSSFNILSDKHHIKCS